MLLLLFAASFSLSDDESEDESSLDLLIFLDTVTAAKMTTHSGLKEKLQKYFHF